MNKNKKAAQNEQLRYLSDELIISKNDSMAKYFSILNSYRHSIIRRYYNTKLNFVINLKIIM